MRRQLVLGASLWEIAAGGVCEELPIPMQTVKIPGMGYVCKVAECDKQTNAFDGRPGCVTCTQDEGTRDPTNVGSEFCPLALGKCDGGKCVPRTDTDYFEKNFGKKWTGLDTFHAVTATHYGGSMAGGGYGDDAADAVAVGKCLQKIGIDGIAAVPAQMYGSDGTGGQALFKRNNLCYKLVGVDGISRVVAVFDRCGGYVQCAGKKNGVQDITSVFKFPDIDMADGADIWADANQCLATSSLVYSGLGQRCWYYTEGSDIVPKDCCAGKCGGGNLQVDWCGSNSHPHFDLTPDLLDMLCDAGGGGGIATGSCQLQWVEPMLCPVWPKPGVCCNGSCGASCQAKSGSCGDNESQCAVCGGTWCAGDKWHDICHADPNDIPSPRPDWTPNPPDPVNPIHPDRTPSPPPPDNADTPTTWPGTKQPGDITYPPGTTPKVTTTRSGGKSTESPISPTTTSAASTKPGGSTKPGQSTHQGDTTTIGPNGPVTDLPDNKPNSKAGVIAGAAAGVAAVLAAAAFGATKLRPQPQLDGDFEADDGEGEDADNREEIVQQGSEDFA